MLLLSWDGERAMACGEESQRDSMTRDVDEAGTMMGMGRERLCGDRARCLVGNEEEIQMTDVCGGPCFV